MNRPSKREFRLGGERKGNDKELPGASQTDNEEAGKQDIWSERKVKAMRQNVDEYNHVKLS